MSWQPQGLTKTSFGGGREGGGGKEDWVILPLTAFLMIPVVECGQTMEKVLLILY